MSVCCRELNVELAAVDGVDGIVVAVFSLAVIVDCGNARGAFSPLLAQIVCFLCQTIFKFVFLAFYIVGPVGWPALLVGYGCCGNFLGKLVDEVVERRIFRAEEGSPYFFHFGLEAGVFGYFSNPSLSERRIYIDEFIVSAVEGVSKIPHRPEDEFRVSTEVFVHIAGTMEGFGIVHHFLYDVKTHQCIEVYVVFPRGGVFVGGVDGRIDIADQIGEIVFLCLGENLGRMVSDPKRGAIAFGEPYLLVFGVVVDFEQPSAGDEVSVGFLVQLLGDVDAVFGYSYILGEEV